MSMPTAETHCFFKHLFLLIFLVGGTSFELVTPAVLRQDLGCISIHQSFAERCFSYENSPF